MKTVGLLGGLAYPSTLEYYEKINATINQQLGGLHSGKVILHSFDFGAIAPLQFDQKWDQLGDIFVERGKALLDAGADFLAICSNTMHVIAPRLEGELGIDLVHIADGVGIEAKAKKIKRLGLLGTKFTMSLPFYAQRLKAHFDIEVIVPNEQEQENINHVIYHELVNNIILEDSQVRFLHIIDNLLNKGAEGVVLGCTEIPLLVNPSRTPAPLFDTMALHVQGITQRMIGI